MKKSICKSEEHGVTRGRFVLAKFIEIEVIQDLNVYICWQPLQKIILMVKNIEVITCLNDIHVITRLMIASSL
jgi:hypothetical protein